MTVNAKNPGISRKLCSIPISTPVKLAFSITKLFSNTIHTENTKGIVKAIANKAIRDIAMKSLSLDDAYKMQYTLLMKQFSDNPDDFKLPSSLGIPDGSPIGSDICNYKPN